MISLTDRRSGASWGINPYPGGIGSSGQWMAPQKYRFNWNAPIVLAPQDPKTVYYGGNVLFKTTNMGHSWEVISPDLTTNDKAKQQSSGGKIVTDNTAAEFHCTILAIGPSPVDPGVIWVGHRRRQRAGDEGRRKELDEYREGDDRPRAECMGEQGRSVALRRGDRLRLGQPLAGRRLRALLLQDDRLRQDVDEDHRAGCPRAGGLT